MTRRYFGTDGIRGRVGEAPITPELVLKLGWAAGLVLAADTRGNGVRPAVLIGKDTRISGYLLEAALESGLSAAGVDVYLSGPLPTPAVAYLTRALRLSAGIVISASHNPFDDNGIKFFSEAGAKLPDSIELSIEGVMDKPLACVPSAQLGKVRRIEDAGGRYIEFCKSTFPSELDLKGWRIVVDCAHGAAYHVAPPVFHELGADVIAVGAEPNGVNINDGVGATNIKHLKAAVLAHEADIGIALDGDGDRLLMVDRQGRALRRRSAPLRDRDGLSPPQGADGRRGRNADDESRPRARAGARRHRARSCRGRRPLRAREAQGEALADRRREFGPHPLPRQAHDGRRDHRRARRAALAGRAARDARAGRRRHHALSAAAHQRPVPKGYDWKANDAIRDAQAGTVTALGDTGRVLLRPSGTEPVLRVMVEAREAGLADKHAQALADVIAAAAGG